MSFCGNCGAEIEGNSAFCGECGSKVVDFEPPKSSIPQTPPPKTASPAVRKPLGLKGKIAIAVAAVLVVIGVAGYMVGKSLTDRDKVVSGFSQALKDKDVKKIEHYLIASDKRMVIDEKGIKGILDYIDQNPSWYQTLTSSLEQQSKSSSSKDSFGSSQYLFELKKEGKKFFFFDNYKIEVKPYFIQLRTNYKDTEVYLNDVSVYKAAQEEDSKELGPYLPGLYKIKSVYKGEYAQLENSRDLVLISESNSFENSSKVETDMSMEGRFIDVNSNYGDAKVVINGKDTGLTVDKAQHIGPVDDSVKVQLKKDFPWGTVTSEEVGAEENTVEIELNPVNDDVKSKIMTTVNQYNDSYMAAMTERNIDKLTASTDNKKADAKYYVDNLLNYQMFFKGKYTKAVYDLDSVRVNPEDNGSYSAEILVTMTSNGIYYSTDPNLPTEEQTYTYKYYLVFDTSDNTWKVDSSASGYSLNSDNLKEFNF